MTFQPRRGSRRTRPEVWKPTEDPPRGQRQARIDRRAAAVAVPSLPTLTREQEAELVNLYHLARTALAGQKDPRVPGANLDTPYQRRLWAAREFVKLHPNLTGETGAYKLLDRLLHPGPI